MNVRFIKNCPLATISSVFFAVLSFIVFLGVACPPLTVYASDIIPVAIKLNTEKKPVIFVVLQDNGDFLLRSVDLKMMGIQQTTGQQLIIDDENYISLRSMRGVTFVFQEATLSLEITAVPELLPVAVVDLLPMQRHQVYYPSEDSLFLNYGLDYAAGTNNGGGVELQSFNVSNELGIRKKNVLFFTDSLYHETQDERSFIRLNTNLTFDQRDKMRRVIVGDSSAFSGTLGSRVNFAGVSVSKSYRINPYFIENPFFNYSGLLPLPAEMVIYSNGVRLRKEQLPPGRFELRNFHNTGGAQDVVLEITDSLGRVQKIYSPFYFSNLMLRQGLSEYSYNLGTLRRDYGLEENRYSHAVFSAHHRYGFTDNLNLGYRTETGNTLFNLGLESLYAFKNYGIFGLDIAGSDDEEGSGWASLFGYEYRTRNYNVRFAWKNFSAGYQTFERQETANKRTSDIRFGIGYTVRTLGSVALDIARTEYQDSADERLIAISYSKRLRRNLHLNSTFRTWDNEESKKEIYLSLTYYFDSEHTLSSTLRQGDDTNSQAVEARSDIPVGEGWGWWSLLEREDNGSSEINTFNPGGQWNTSHGIYRGEVNLNSENESYRLAASGALVSLGGEYGLTRPVRDSFGLVKVNDLEGVRVYTNGQELGSTNDRGVVFIPELTSFYNNRISIEDQDISIDYLMPQVEKTVSPPFRSGSCVSFSVEKYQAFTGTLFGRIGEVTKPLEFYQGEFFGAMRTIKFFTGSGGEFYFDNDSGTNGESVPGLAEEGCTALNASSAAVFHPGTYGGQATSEAGAICRFELNLPETDERYFDLGEILCSPAAEVVTSLESGTISERIEKGTFVPTPKEAVSSPVEAGVTGQLPDPARGEETVAD